MSTQKAMSDAKTVPGVCRAFNSKSGCNNCRNLHICFFFAAGKCRYENQCVRTHLLTTVHNKTVLKENGWLHDNQHPKIMKMLEEKLKPKSDPPKANSKTDGLNPPKVCFTYNTLGCQSETCTHLHLCLNSILGKCTHGAKCHLEHDIINDDHNIRVLRSAKLLDTEKQVIADKLRDMYIAMSNQQNKPEPQKKPEQKQTQLPAGPNSGKDQKTPRAPCVCIAYNKAGCKNASCPFLHVCFSYIIGSCDKKGGCQLEHSCTNGEQNLRILRQFNLLGSKNMVAKIRVEYEARAKTKAAAIEEREGATGGATPPPPPPRPTSAAPTSLTCTVCCEPFIKATTLGCSHTFCGDCVQRTVRQANACPLCRAPIASSVRSLVVDDTVEEWLDGQDEATQRARRQLVAERRRGGVLPLPETKPAPEPTAEPAAKPAPKKNYKPGPRQNQQRSKSQGRGAKTVVTTTVTYQ